MGSFPESIFNSVPVAVGSHDMGSVSGPPDFRHYRRHCRSSKARQTPDEPLNPQMQTLFTAVEGVVIFKKNARLLHRTVLGQLFELGTFCEKGPKQVWRMP